MRCLVINCSSPHYSLGAAKLADWLRGRGDTVDFWPPTNGDPADPGMFAYGYDLVALSVVFSWHAPVAREIALRVKGHADVWCGGPGMHALRKWWERETGLKSSSGVDGRFDRQRGDYPFTFASRGCPVDCWFCIVPRIEGKTFTLDWDFRPAPVLCDNNLSALPDEFQRHIIVRYQDAGVPLKDANSGFEPRTFTEETYRRWKPVLRGPWRFAYDTTDEGRFVEPMMGILKGESPKRKQVYVLIGNEPIAACHQRVREVIAWGGEPYCQPLMPLNALSRDTLIVRHDWTVQRLRDFTRWVNRHLWRKVPLHQYADRKNEAPPFAEILA